MNIILPKLYEDRETTFIFADEIDGMKTKELATIFWLNGKRYINIRKVFLEMEAKQTESKSIEGDSGYDDAKDNRCVFCKLTEGEVEEHWKKYQINLLCLPGRTHSFYPVKMHPISPKSPFLTPPSNLQIQQKITEEVNKIVEDARTADHPAKLYGSNLPKFPEGEAWQFQHEFRRENNRCIHCNLHLVEIAGTAPWSPKRICTKRQDEFHNEVEKIKKYVQNSPVTKPHEFGIDGICKNCKRNALEIVYIPLSDPKRQCSISPQVAEKTTEFQI